MCIRTCWSSSTSGIDAWEWRNLPSAHCHAVNRLAEGFMSAGFRALLDKRVLLVSTDPAHSTSDMFERPIGPEPVPLLPNLHGLEIDGAFESQRYVANVKEHIKGLFGHEILKEANKQIDLAASMPGAEEMALFDRIGGLIRGEDDRFDLIVFDTAPTGHTLRLIP